MDRDIAAFDCSQASLRSVSRLAVDRRCEGECATDVSDGHVAGLLEALPTSVKFGARLFMVAQSDRCGFHFGWRSLVPRATRVTCYGAWARSASPTGLRGESFLPDCLMRKNLPVLP